MPSNLPKGNEYTPAGFFVRFFAYLIDHLIVGFGLLFVRMFYAGIAALIADTPISGNVLFNFTLKDIVLYLFGALYFVLMTYYTGTTLGKKLMNLQVISAEKGKKPSFMDILFRETIGRFLSSVILYIGYFMIGVDKEKKGLHDTLSDTRVVYARKVKVIPVYPQYAAAPPVPPAPPVAPMPPTNNNEIKKEL
ncbi:RDD family protein [Lachnospiraceae bacterium OttesenSCG-928-J05]|nr:RDD family protein [Lachnospiraceae bacterium OttesenSCG-928-J05]